MLNFAHTFYQGLFVFGIAENRWQLRIMFNII